jgi:hypothetical protein
MTLFLSLSFTHAHTLFLSLCTRSTIERREQPEQRESGGGGGEREREKERTRKDQTSAESRRQRTHNAAPRVRQEKGLVVTRNAGSVYHITEHSRVCVREREKRERRASERKGERENREEISKK